MIRLIHCMKRKESVSVDEFRKFLEGDEFNNILNRMLGKLLAVEIKLNVTFDIEQNITLRSERGAKAPFDAVFEIIWQSGSDVAAAYRNES